MGDLSRRPRPEIADGFYNTDESGIRTEIACTLCSSRAVVKDGDNYFCARDWEFRI